MNQVLTLLRMGFRRPEVPQEDKEDFRLKWYVCFVFYNLSRNADLSTFTANPAYKSICRRDGRLSEVMRDNSPESADSDLSGFQ